MATLGRLMVTVGADISEMERGLQSARDKISGFGDAATRTGGMLTAGLTAPIVGMAVAAISASTKMNEGLANIASLGIAEERVLAMKGIIQDLAISMGKDTGDMTGGMYEVISAFGDTENSMAILEIAARSGAAGLTDTKEAIKVLSSVTQGYNDTSLEAVQKTADLLFTTVNLGQTTFPELAASIGNVVPFANLLGVSQEELFAQMATIAGVTGSTSEATTQLRAAYGALLTPTTDMADAIDYSARKLEEQGKLAGGPLVDNWKAAREEQSKISKGLVDMKTQLANLENATTPNVKATKAMKAAVKDQEKAMEDATKAVKDQAAALGPALVASVGLNGAFEILGATTNGNLDTLGTMYGSVEALGAVASLTGKQAESFAIKLEAMGNVAGATDAAFLAQTQGINKLGFTWAQLQVRVQVALQKIGDGLAPALNAMVVAIQPLVDYVLGLADAFALMDEPTQIMIVTIAGIAAAIGPALLAVGAMSQGLAFLLSPIGLIIAGVGLLTVAWVQNWGGIQEKTATAWAIIRPQLELLRDYLVAQIPGALQALSDLWATGWSTIQNALALAWVIIQPALFLIWSWLQNILPVGLQGWKNAWTVGWSAIRSALTISWNYIRGVFLSFNAWLQTNLPTSLVTFSTDWGAHWTTIKEAFTTAWQVIEVKFLAIFLWLRETLSSGLTAFSDLWAANWPIIRDNVISAWNVIRPALQSLWAWILLNKEEIQRIATAALGFFIFREVASIVYTLILPFVLLAGALSTVLQFFINLGIVAKGLITIVTAIATPVGLAAIAVLALAGALGYLFYYDISGFRTKTVQAFEALQKAIQQVIDIVAPYFLPALERIREASDLLGERMTPLAASFGRLGEALKPVAFGLGIIGGIIAGLIGVTAITALNLLASALEQLPTIVGAMVDNLTATLETINATVKTMIAAVKLAITGDWAGAWQEAKKIVAIYWLYFNRTINNFHTIVHSVFTLIKDTIVSTLEQLGVDTTAFLTNYQTNWDAQWALLVGAVNTLKTAAENLVTYLSGAFTDAWEALKKMLTFDFPNPFKAIQDAIKSMADKIQPLLDALQKLRDWSGGADTVVNPALQQRRQPSFGGGLIAAGASSSMITVNVTVSDPKDKNEWRKVARMVADEFERIRRT